MRVRGHPAQAGAAALPVCWPRLKAHHAAIAAGVLRRPMLLSAAAPTCLQNYVGVGMLCPQIVSWSILFGAILSWWARQLCACLHCLRGIAKSQPTILFPADSDVRPLAWQRMLGIATQAPLRADFSFGCCLLLHPGAGASCGRSSPSRRATGTPLACPAPTSGGFMATRVGAQAEGGARVGSRGLVLLHGSG